MERFVARQADPSAGKRIDYRRFVDYYTNHIKTLDQGGFLNLGQLPATMGYENAEEEKMEKKLYAEDVESYATRLASVAERQMYSGGGDALDPSAYDTQTMAPTVHVSLSEIASEEHDQTERLNRSLLGSMLDRMGGVQSREEDYESQFGFDPAVMSEAELEQLIASRG
jgi:hypothetical protein